MQHFFSIEKIDIQKANIKPKSKKLSVKYIKQYKKACDEGNCCYRQAWKQENENYKRNFCKRHAKYKKYAFGTHEIKRWPLAKNNQRQKTKIWQSRKQKQWYGYL